MTPYPVIDVKATGENILRRRIERGYTVLDMQRYLNLACPQSVYHCRRDGRCRTSITSTR